MPAPTAAITRLLGKACCLSRSSLGPRTQAATKPDTPADIWMTYPPEKSSDPSWAKYPPPQSRKASTQYTQVDHRGTSRHQALNLIRPSTLPRNSSGVMAANTNWKYRSESVGKWNGTAVLAADTAWPCSL